MPKIKVWPLNIGMTTYDHIFTVAFSVKTTHAGTDDGPEQEGDEAPTAPMTQHERG